MTRRRPRPVLIALAILSSATIPAIAPPATLAQVATESHCATLLVPTEETPTQGPGPIDAELVPLGCYDTLDEAVAVGSLGAIDLPAGTEPADLTQATLDASTDDVTTASTVALGTEWVEFWYASSSNTYFASSTCTDTTTWQVANVGSTYDNDYESGKGFGGCDRNRKFQHTNFDGDVLVCRPNCSDYGTLRNEVSSLRWRA